MSKQSKKLYRALAWFFSVVIAAGTLAGCGMKYGPPTSKYGPPPPNGYSDAQNIMLVQNDEGTVINNNK